MVNISSDKAVILSVCSDFVLSSLSSACCLDMLTSAKVCSFIMLFFSRTSSSFCIRSSKFCSSPTLLSYWRIVSLVSVEM
ncbi:hypothetical protein FKM82_022591 [Ascaphus truei]